MKERGFLARCFGESNSTVRRSIITYFGILLFLGGILFILKGVSGHGIINIKVALDNGKLDTGSVGILISGLGFLLLIVSSLFRDR